MMALTGYLLQDVGTGVDLVERAQSPFPPQVMLISLDRSQLSLSPSSPDSVGHSVSGHVTVQ